MFTESLVLTMYFETPLHTGATGALGAIDLPVARERTTLWPVVHAAQVKEGLRKSLTQTEEAVAKLLSGPEAALSVGDARLLLFPVRSSAAPLLWVTCPSVLWRLRRDLERTVGITIPAPPTVGAEEVITSSGWKHGSEPLAVEDVVLTPKPGFEANGVVQVIPSASAAYEGFAREVESAVGVVSDDVFGFLVRTTTEVVQATEQPATYQELVPSDTLFYLPVMGAAATGKGKKAVSAIETLEKSLGTHVQVGADANLGRGWARIGMLKAKAGAQ